MYSSFNDLNGQNTLVESSMKGPIWFKMKSVSEQGDDYIILY